MDQGLAVVIGAVIALVGAIGAPWIRESVQARRLAERARRDDLRVAINAFLAAAIAVHQRDKRRDREAAILEASVAGARVSLLLKDGEMILEHIAEEAIALTPMLGKGDPDLRIKSLVLVTAYQMTVIDWFRGRVPTDKVRGAYNWWCVELVRLPEDDPFRRAQTRPVD
jgi:hypothetical protein